MILLFPTLAEAAEPRQEPQYVICPTLFEEKTNKGVVSLVRVEIGVTSTRTGAVEFSVVKPFVVVQRLLIAFPATSLTSVVIRIL